MATTKQTAGLGLKNKKKARGKARNRKLPPTVTVHRGETRPGIIGGSVNYKVEVYIPPDTTIHYADNLSVTHTEYEFIISFLQLQPPIILEGGDWNDVEKVQTKCVTRIAIAPPRMPLFIDALIKNWQRYAAKMNVTEGTDVAATNEAPEGAEEK